MYKIIGGDQKEYGPVSFDQISAWVRDNRANAQSLVQREGGPWVPLGSLPEFAPVLGLPTPEVPPSVPPTAAPFPPGPMPGVPMSRNTMDPGFGAVHHGNPANALNAVQGPATGLLVTGILGAIAVLIGLVFTLIGGANMANPPADMPPELRQFMNMIRQLESPAVVVVDAVVKLGVAGLIIFSALRLKRLESFPLAVTAAILAIVPCTSPCCCVGLPIGIWVLVAIMKPEVKSAFR